MNYEKAAQIRRMAELVCSRLGHTDPPSIIDPEPSYTYQDGFLRMYSKPDGWVEISARNPAGYYGKALEVGGLLCKGNDELMASHLDRLKALYIAAHFLQTIDLTPSAASFKPTSYQQGVN